MAAHSRRHKVLGSGVVSPVLYALDVVLPPHAPVAQVAVNNNPDTCSINHFVDGDTIAVNMNGKVEAIRFIGVDTPETHKPNTPVQCYGPAAAAYTKAMIGRSACASSLTPIARTAIATIVCFAMSICRTARCSMRS